MLVVAGVLLLGGGVALAAALTHQPDPCPGQHSLVWRPQSSGQGNAGLYQQDANGEFVCAVAGPAGPAGPQGPAGPAGTATIDDVSVDVSDYRTKNCHTTIVVTVTVNGISDTDSTRFGGCNRGR
jgi:hypothetical protein